MPFIMTLFLWLIIYSFIGWTYESTLCSITGKKLVNRGFLNGPICPVYGFGALIIILTLSNNTSNIFSLFLSSCVLTTILEYLTSYLLEKCFHARWWDYSRYKFQLNGRVCLLGAIVFGALSTLLVLVVHPFILKVLHRFSVLTLSIITITLFFIFVLDLYATVHHLLLLNGRLQEIQQAINLYSDASKLKVTHFKESLIEKFESSEFYSQRIDYLMKLKKFQDKRLLHAFPTLKSTRYEEALEKIRTHLNNLPHQKKK